jgi:hypothetical protein
LISPSSDWIELLRGLNDASVKYLVVGAHALGVYGAPRATGDLDIWIERSAENAARVYRALAEFGAPLGDLSVRDLQSDDLILAIGTQPLRIDIITDIDAVIFEEAWQRRIEDNLFGVPVPFIGRDDFIRNKRATGRPKDLADVVALESGESLP